jgi:hypothetical protein
MYLPKLFELAAPVVAEIKWTDILINFCSLASSRSKGYLPITLMLHLHSSVYFLT